MSDTVDRAAVIDTDSTVTPPSSASAASDPASTSDVRPAADRVFQPSAEFAANANLTAEAYQRAAADPEAFWAEQANRLTWATPFTQVLVTSASSVFRRHLPPSTTFDQSWCRPPAGDHRIRTTAPDRRLPTVSRGLRTHRLETSAVQLIAPAASSSLASACHAAHESR
jgi:hypothetical protein